MFTRTKSRAMSQCLAALLAGSTLLSACIPAVSTTTLPKPTATSASVATLEPTATTAPAATAVPASDGSLHLALDTGKVATGLQIETVTAAPAGTDAPFWEVLPEYTRATLQGYPISSHLMKLQIFVYPVENLGKVNEGTGKIAASLQTLLRSPQEVPNLPFLPLFNASQVIHAQTQYLDFKNGQGCAT